MPSISVAGLQLENIGCKTIEDVRRQVEHACSMIKLNKGHQIYLLPELSPMGYNDTSFHHLKELGAQAEIICKESFSALAKHAGCYICFGVAAMSSSTDRWVIRYIVISPDGEISATYDKIHLCNYGDCSESKLFDAGSQLCIFDAFGIKVR
jgi:predicted amidohydrolase